MYSFTRSWIGRKEARTLIARQQGGEDDQDRLMPSTPTLYWIPKDGIQAMSSMNWKPARAGDEAGEHDAATQPTRPAPSRAPRQRTAADARRGMNAIDDRADERA